MIRRTALKTLTGTALTIPALTESLASPMTQSDPMSAPLKGRINHSVCKWCYAKIPLDDFCKSIKAMGITSVDLTGPEEWPTLKKYGLTCAMAQGAGKGINDGFNNPKLHDELVASYEAIFPR